MKKIIILVFLVTNLVQSQAIEGSQILDFNLPTNQNGLSYVRVNVQWRLSVFQGSLVLSYDSYCEGNTYLNYRGKTYTGISNAISYGALQDKIRNIECTDPTVSLKITGPGINKRIQVQIIEGKNSGSGFGSVNSTILGNATNTGTKGFDVIIEHVVSVVYKNTQPAYAEIEKIEAEKEKIARLEIIKKNVSNKIEAENFNSVLEDLRLAKNQFPNEPWISEKIKEVEKLQNKQKEELIKKNKKIEAEKLKNQANSLIKEKNYTGARELLKKAENLNPDDIEIQELLKSLESISSSNLAKTGNNSSKPNSSQDDFWNDIQSNNSTSSKSKPKTKEEKDAELYAETMQKQQAYTDNFINSIKEQKEKDEQNWIARQESFYAAERLRNAKQNLSQGSKLSQDHKSIESLEKEFQQKMNSINQLVNEEVAAKNQKWETDVKYAYRNSSESDKAFGELVSTFGTIINSASAEKEEKYRREKLEKERIELKKKIEEEIAVKKAELMIEFRLNLIQQFPEGGLPFSKDKIPVNELYFFAYIYDPNNLKNQTPEITITNTFPVAQYKDGTWPFKNDITNDLKKSLNVSNLKIVLVGYYGSEETASEYRKSLIEMSKKSGFIQKNIIYNGNKASNNQNNNDFWETGTKKKEKKKTQDDFWNN